MKKCCRCDLEKQEIEFGKHKNRYDGLQSFCKMCARNYSNTHYKKEDVVKRHREDIKERNKKNRLRNQKYIREYLLKHPCVDCGESDPLFLEFDHQRDKTDSIANLSRHGSSIKRLQEEIEKCQVRCVKCHRRKTAKDFGWYRNLE